MTPHERAALTALLTQIRSLHRDLNEYNAGICLLHLDATAAALERHLARGGANATEELHHGLASSAAAR